MGKKKESTKISLENSSIEELEEALRKAEEAHKKCKDNSCDKCD